MPRNDSVEYFLRFLRERFNAFRESLTEFLQALTLEGRPRKVEAARKVLILLDDLKRAMSEEDRPAWISQLEHKLTWYTSAVEKEVDAGLQVVQTIMVLEPQIKNQAWDFTDSASNLAIDFASIYEEYLRDSRIPELFDELVAQLEVLAGSDEIDSRKAVRKLRKLIETIRKNSRGDLFSTRGAWEFTQIFFKNYAVELIEKIPGLSSAYKALRATLTELDVEFSQLHGQIWKKLSDAAGPDLLPDAEEPELPMLEYRRLLSLPAAESDLEARNADAGDSENVIEADFEISEEGT